MPKALKQRIELEVEDRASGPVGRVESRFRQLGSFLASRFVITLSDVVGAFRTLAGAIGSTLTAAQEQQDAVNRLDVALKKAGPSAFSFSRALQEQAAQLEATTRFSDEAIIANQALALNLGASAEQSEKLTKAAVELAAATGRGLEFAFVNLTRTLNGARGELNEFIPGLAELDAEALKAGAALDLVIGNLGGTAQEDVNSFSGQIAQLGNAFGTLQEKVGEAIIENEKITGAIGSLRDVITSPGFVSAVEQVADSLARIVISTVEFVAGANALLGPLRQLAQTFREWRRELGGLARDLEDVVRLLLRLLEVIPGFGFIGTVRNVQETTTRIREAGRASLEASGGTRPTTRSGGGAQE